MLPLVLALLGGGGVALAVYGFTIGETPDAVALRLSQFAGSIKTPTPTLREVEMAAAPRDRIVKPAIARISRIVSNFHGQSALEKLEKQLLQAGNPNGMTVEDLLGWKGLAVLGLGGIGLFFGWRMGGSLGQLILFGGAGGAVGYMVPSMLLKSKIKKRQKSIMRVLPDAIDMLSISVEAGLGFDAAIGRLSAKMHNELTAEFDRVSAEIRMGRRRRDALKNLIERTGVDDLSAFVNAIIQADHLGVGVTQVLKTQAQAIRIRRRQRAEERARKAPVKMMFPLVGLLFPPLMIIILGPALPALLSGMHATH